MLGKVFEYLYSEIEAKSNKYKLIIYKFVLCSFLHLLPLLLLLVNRALHLHPLLVIELVHLVHLCGLLLARRRVRSQAGVAGGRHQNSSEPHNSPFLKSTLSHLAPLLKDKHIEPKASCQPIRRIRKELTSVSTFQFSCRFPVILNVKPRGFSYQSTQFHGFVQRQAFEKLESSSIN